MRYVQCSISCALADSSPGLLRRSSVRLRTYRLTPLPILKLHFVFLVFPSALPRHLEASAPCESQPLHHLASPHGPHPSDLSSTLIHAQRPSEIKQAQHPLHTYTQCSSACAALPCPTLPSPTKQSNRPYTASCLYLCIHDGSWSEVEAAGPALERLEHDLNLAGALAVVLTPARNPCSSFPIDLQLALPVPLPSSQFQCLLRFSA